MKLVIKTRLHFGDKNIGTRQGVQFAARFVASPTDTIDEYKAIHELIEIVKADCKDSGYYLGFERDANSDQKHCKRTTQCGDTPYTPRERALKVRAVSAENLARDYKKALDELRLVMVRNGINVRKDMAK